MSNKNNLNSKYNRLKRLTYEILEDNSGKKGVLYLIDDYFIGGLIILNVIAIILESFETMHPYMNYFYIFDVFSVVVFSVEYVLRVWIADYTYPSESKLKSRLKYIFSPLGVVDLLAILPFYISAWDLRMLRVLRLFKLAHYMPSLKLFGRVLNNEKEKLFITVIATLIIILLTASAMYHIEHQLQPDKFPNIFATFWWAIATLTTIGYGDVFPISGWGQFMAAITALFGIGLVAIPTGIIAMGFVEEIQKEKADVKAKKNEDNPPEYNYCPHCGKKLRD